MAKSECISKRLAACMAALVAIASLACGATGKMTPNEAHLKAYAQQEAARGDKGAKAWLDVFDGARDAAAVDAALAWIVAAALQGRPEAMYQAAQVLRQKAGSHPTDAEAMRLRATELIVKAAERGYAPAQIHLAQLHTEGKVVALDNAKAMTWATKAAQAGDVQAQAWMGARYLEGLIVPKDAAKAIEWLEKAAGQGSTEAARLLAALREAKPANAERIAAAERGEVAAQASLGFDYLVGRGIPKDAKQALHWLTRAAESGHPIAQVNLGLAYANGLIVPKDERRAVEWYRRSADQGNRSGQSRLALAHEMGRGVTRDKAAAIELYRKAAAQGDAFASERLKKLGE